MQMNLFENIKIFIEIVDAGSFAQAAENLQIHRPAVTKALQQLERESGVRLLQRTTRRLYLTPEGEEFYRRSKPLLSQADDLLESFAPDRPIRGQLRVDMPIAFARLLVIPHLADFYQAHPEVEIVLSSSDVRRDMLRDGLDCLLRVGDLEDGDYVGLPTADDSWNFKTFTKDEYEALKSKIASGELVVDNSSDDATKPTVSEFTKVNYIQ